MLHLDDTGTGLNGNTDAVINQQQYQVPINPGVCPGCGRCNVCGRPRHNFYPWYDPYYQYPNVHWSDSSPLV